MTKAHFWKTVDGETLTFNMQVNGHADFAKGTPDIVCAACSMLVQATMVAMHEESLFLCERWEIDSKEGKASLKCITFDALGAERAESMMSVAKTGFELLAAKYPENVCVTGEKPKHD